MNRLNTRLKRGLITLVSLFLASIWSVQAKDSSVKTNQTKADVIAKTIKAYGGDKLRQLKSIDIQDDYLAFRYGQSYQHDNVDLVQNKYSLYIDLKDTQSAFQWRYGSSDNFNVQHLVHTDNKTFRIEHNEKTITENSGVSFARADRNHRLLLDTYLAYLLTGQLEKVSLLDTTQYFGDKHYRLSVKAKGLPKLVLWIDDKTGLISQVERPYWREGQQFVYRFSDYQRVAGVTYAQSAYLSRGGHPYNVVKQRSVSFNRDIANQFKLPEHYQQSPVSRTESVMQAKKLADNLYLVGQGWGYSMFYDQGDYIVAAGLYARITERYEALKAEFSIDKPLKYVVVSHHHFDHLGGIKEAEQLGANFVTVEYNVPMIKQFAEKDLPDSRFVLVDKKQTIADGKVLAVDRSSRHAIHNVMTIIPEHNIVFSADTYFTQQTTGAPKGSKSLMGFAEVLASTGIAIDKFAAAHSIRVLTQEDFQFSLNNLSPDVVCPIDWRVCSNPQTVTAKK